MSVSPASPRVVTEPGGSLPVAGDVDVLVAGGGPAGFAAAIAAARAGARVALIEHHGCLGGVWTVGLLSLIIDAANKQGIMAEFLERLQDAGGRGTAPDGRRTTTYDAEVAKRVLEAMCIEAGVRVRLHTRIVGALKDPFENARMVCAVTESRSGREAWRARVFIDATGDGDLAARAGCAFSVGHPQSGLMQPMSLIALLTGCDASRVEQFLCGIGNGRSEEAKQELRAVIERGGVSPSYANPTIFRIHPDLYALMANHEYGVRFDDADGLSAATIRARAEVAAIVAAMQLGDAQTFGQTRLVATGSQIGVREGRRIRGEYELTCEDLVRGARFDDAVCRATFCVDIHALDPKKDKGYGNAGVKAQPYDIPLRSLIAQDASNLMLAGRCISGDFFAHASYRVTGNAVAMGEGAGRAAAHCAAAGVSPRELARDGGKLAVAVASLTPMEPSAVP